MRDRAGAVATYRAFEARLREELGIAPMDETVRLYECIVRGELSLIEADPALARDRDVDVGRSSGALASVNGNP